jgi:phage-related protein
MPIESLDPIQSLRNDFEKGYSDTEKAEAIVNSALEGIKNNAVDFVSTIIRTKREVSESVVSGAESFSSEIFSAAKSAESQVKKSLREYGFEIEDDESVSVGKIAEQASTKVRRIWENFSGRASQFGRRLGYDVEHGVRATETVIKGRAQEVYGGVTEKLRETSERVGGGLDRGEERILSEVERVKTSVTGAYEFGKSFASERIQSAVNSFDRFGKDIEQGVDEFAKQAPEGLRAAQNAFWVGLQSSAERLIKEKTGFDMAEWRERTKRLADAEGSLLTQDFTNTSTKYIQGLGDRLNALESSITNRDVKIEKLEAQLADLQAQLAETADRGKNGKGDAHDIGVSIDDAIAPYAGS